MNFKAFSAEFIGTFCLVFIGVGAVTADHLTNGAVGLTGIALAHGLAVAVMISATGSISRGFFNPAISLGVLLSGSISAIEFVGYVIAQCLGAIAASSLLMSSLPELALDAVNYGIPAVGESVTPSMAVVTEIVLTFFLVFVVFGTAIDKRAPKLGGLFIGLAVTLDTFMGGPISGAAMNPARWLGPAVISGDFMNAWVYWVGPLAGGALAAAAYAPLSGSDKE